MNLVSLFCFLLRKISGAHPPHTHTHTYTDCLICIILYLGTVQRIHQWCQKLCTTSEGWASSSPCRLSKSISANGKRRMWVSAATSGVYYKVAHCKNAVKWDFFWQLTGFDPCPLQLHLSDLYLFHHSWTLTSTEECFPWLSRLWWTKEMVSFLNLSLCDKAQC